MIKKFTEQDMINYADYVAKAVLSNIQPDLTHWYAEWHKTAKKVIDLSVLIKSGIDCEFSDNSSWEVTTIGKLYSLDTSNFLPYVLGSKQVSFKCVRPRMNHKHAWQGGECPFPEGFMVKVWFRNKEQATFVAEATHIAWEHEEGFNHHTSGYDIMYFEVLGLADGYVNALGARQC
tara:strand:+ start:459 stop:986 length:528 start_codon:yes stop_codon:yes gene_type:complete